MRTTLALWPPCGRLNQRGTQSTTRESLGAGEWRRLVRVLFIARLGPLPRPARRDIPPLVFDRLHSIEADGIDPLSLSAEVRDPICMPDIRGVQRRRMQHRDDSRRPKMWSLLVGFHVHHDTTDAGAVGC